MEGKDRKAGGGAGGGHRQQEDVFVRKVITTEGTRTELPPARFAY